MKLVKETKISSIISKKIVVVIAIEALKGGKDGLFLTY